MDEVKPEKLSGWEGTFARSPVYKIAFYFFIILAFLVMVKDLVIYGGSELILLAVAVALIILWPIYQKRKKNT